MLAGMQQPPFWGMQTWMTTSSGPNTVASTKSSQLIPSWLVLKSPPVLQAEAVCHALPATLVACSGDGLLPE